MKIKMIAANERRDTDFQIDCPFIPRINEWINIHDLLSVEQINEIKKSAFCWSGEKGIVQSVEYRRNGGDFFVELYVWCED
jgi:hypothetical protein